MDFVLALFVLASALAVLAYPLYRARTQPVTVNASTLDDLLSQRDGVYATLRDLEQDKELGKLDAADYDALHEKYIARAAEILQELDALRGEGDAKAASEEIEAEVVAMRKRAPASALVKPLPTAKPAKEAELFCTNCGRQHKPGDKFCAKCGHALS
jgi:hypothetical protein